MKTLKKTLSMFLVLAMVLAFVPAVFIPAAFALETRDDETDAPINFEAFAADYGYEEDATSGNAKIEATVGSNTIVIDLNLEKIYWNSGTAPENQENTSPVVPVMVSFDAGGKWSALKFSIGTSLEPADFSKQLDKGGTIWLCTAWDAKNKCPLAADVTETDPTTKVKTTVAYKSVIYKFAKIEARPKLDGFKPEYKTKSAIADGGSDGDAPYGRWTLVNSKGTQKMADLQVAYSTDGKKPAGDPDEPGDAKYGVFGANATAGVPVIEGKTKPGEKLTYLIRVAPSTNHAASKPKKINILTAGKAPTVKIDYKKELVKLKAGMVWGTVTLNTVKDLDPAMAGDSTADDPVPTSIKTFAIGIGITTATTKEATQVKDGLIVTAVAANSDLKKYLQYGEDYGVQIWATEKKPASLVQPLSIAEVPNVDPTAIGTVEKGKFKVAKGYEACLTADVNKAGTKWGAVKATASAKYSVRKKNNAKYNAKTNVTTGSPASTAAAIEVNWETLDAKKPDKMGITGYVILDATIPATDTKSVIVAPGATASAISAKNLTQKQPATQVTGSTVLNGDAVRVTVPFVLKSNNPALASSVSDISGLGSIFEVKTEPVLADVGLKAGTNTIGTSVYTVEFIVEKAIGGSFKVWLEPATAYQTELETVEGSYFVCPAVTVNLNVKDEDATATNASGTVTLTYGSGTKLATKVSSITVKNVAISGTSANTSGDGAADPVTTANREAILALKDTTLNTGVPTEGAASFGIADLEELLGAADIDDGYKVTYTITVEFDSGKTVDITFDQISGSKKT